MSGSTQWPTNVTVYEFGKGFTRYGAHLRRQALKRPLRDEDPVLPFLRDDDDDNDHDEDGNNGYGGGRLPKAVALREGLITRSFSLKPNGGKLPRLAFMDERDEADELCSGSVVGSDADEPSLTASVERKDPTVVPPPPVPNDPPQPQLTLPAPPVPFEDVACGDGFLASPGNEPPSVEPRVHTRGAFTVRAPELYGPIQVDARQSIAACAALSQRVSVAQPARTVTMYVSGRTFAVIDDDAGLLRGNTLLSFAGVYATVAGVLCGFIQRHVLFGEKKVSLAAMPPTFAMDVKTYGRGKAIKRVTLVSEPARLRLVSEIVSAFEWCTSLLPSARSIEVGRSLLALLAESSGSGCSDDDDDAGADRDGDSSGCGAPVDVDAASRICLPRRRWDSDRGCYVLSCDCPPGVDCAARRRDGQDRLARRQTLAFAFVEAAFYADHMETLRRVMVIVSVMRVLHSGDQREREQARGELMSLYRVDADGDGAPVSSHGCAVVSDDSLESYPSSATAEPRAPKSKLSDVCLWHPVRCAVSGPVALHVVNLYNGGSIVVYREAATRPRSGGSRGPPC